MRKFLVITLVLVFSPVVLLAQTNTLDLDDLLQSAHEWAKENLDDDALRVLENVDQARVKAVLNDLQQRLRGEYVFDLAPLKQAGETVLPLLQGYEETLPYALWLKNQFDYLDVAQSLSSKTPLPKPIPGHPPKPRPNPPPQVEREVWIEKLSDRPWPASAKGIVPRLKPIFVAEKVPAELVWVAEVESSFDPRARSPVGAAGLFQLMPDTASRFGLRTWPVDQRLKPEPSASASAKYLHFLYNRFKDWRLALAAYNAGEGTLEKLLRGRREQTFDAIAVRLPAETQLFVPKVEATVLRREGVKLSQLR